jgi:uncharacterized protein
VTHHSPEQDAQRLLSLLQSYRQVVVALSGGVDSSVVAAAAHRARLELAIAVTADSPSVPRWQLETARTIAAEIGIEHHILPTGEADRQEYRRNDNQRCFFCKQTLYWSLAAFTCRYPNMTILSGTNADDLGDYRPGIEAGNQSGVVTPLADLGLGKSQVRAIASHFGLSNRDLPASPCLASRIAYAVEVTPERLRQIERAEDWLRQQGFREFRVRLHADQLARIEVPKDQLPRLIEMDHDGELTREFQSIGFKFVTIDLEGFRSGSMNRVLVSAEALKPSGAKEAVH